MGLCVCVCVCARLVHMYECMHVYTCVCVCVHISLNAWERYASNYSPSTYRKIIGQIRLFHLGVSPGLGEGNL